MNEEIKNAANSSRDASQEAKKDLYAAFIPSVHRIGRITMLIGLFLTFLPVLYFVLVKGYRAPLSGYVSVAIAISSFCFGVWLTEPLAYWPVLGSAGTYMGYLSGNVSGMRFPVAMSIQTTLDSDINTAKGQAATIIGVVASVFMNLVILFIFVLGGQWLVTVLPEAVINSFAFVTNGIFISLLLSRMNGKEGLGKGVMDVAPYLIIAVVSRLIFDHIPSVSAWKISLVVVICVLLGYVMYRRDCKKDEEAKKAGR